MLWPPNVPVWILGPAPEGCWSCLLDRKPVQTKTQTADSGKGSTPGVCLCLQLHTPPSWGTASREHLCRCSVLHWFPDEAVSGWILSLQEAPVKLHQRQQCRRFSFHCQHVQHLLLFAIACFYCSINWIVVLTFSITTGGQICFCYLLISRNFLWWVSAPSWTNTFQLLISVF